MTNMSGANLNNGAAVGPQGEGRESPSSFPKYPAYKDSGVEWLGVVPEHWGVSPLKWLVEQVTDKATTSDFQVGLENIEGWTGRFIETDTEFAGDGIAFRQEDILFGKLRPYLAKVWLAGRSGQAVGDFFVLRPRTVNSEFLHKYILTPTVIEDLNASTIGAKMPRVGWEDMAALAVTLPPHKEQTQIARFLDHETARIDALIEEQQRLIELLKEKRQAVISHAVTKGLDPTVPMKDSGVEWLGEVPAHWNVIRLGQNIRTRKGFAFSAADFSDEGAAVVKASDIKNHSINEPSTFIGFEFLKKTPNAILKKGNLVLSTVGSTPDVKNSAVGQIGCVPQHLDGALLNQNTVIFEPTDARVSSEYLFFALLTTAYRDHLDLNAHGTANQASLSLSDMLSFCIPLPDLDEQKTISSELSRVLENVKALERESESLVGLLTERRSALISAAVTGKIDVRGWQPPASAPTPELVEEAV